jgi:hypothetical protein
MEKAQLRRQGAGAFNRPHCGGVSNGAGLLRAMERRHARSVPTSSLPVLAGACSGVPACRRTKPVRLPAKDQIASKEVVLSIQQSKAMTARRFGRSLC